MTELLVGFQAMSGWEYLAVLCSALYIWLAIKQNPWCFAAGIAGTTIYTLLFWQTALLMESLLNAYYVLMAFYGAYQWQRGGQQQQPLPVQSWPVSFHVQLVTTLSVVAITLGFLMANYTHAEYPYLDTATTVFSIFATYMLAKKILEHWLYWVVIDIATLYLYFQKGFYPSMVLFVGYTVMAVWGYWQWQKSQQPIHY